LRKPLIFLKFFAPRVSTHFAAHMGFHPEVAARFAMLAIGAVIFCANATNSEAALFAKLAIR
jgi:hypothetical protein